MHLIADYARTCNELVVLVATVAGARQQIRTFVWGQQYCIGNLFAVGVCLCTLYHLLITDLVSCALVVHTCVMRSCETHNGASASH